MFVMVVPILMGLLESLISKKLFATVICEGLRRWADWSDSVHDERIVDAISQALEVDTTSLKELQMKSTLKTAEKVEAKK
jgi:hypothetical protein